MSSQRTLRFGEFELDVENQLLSRHGVVIRLAPQPFKVLLVLVESGGSLVRREVLRQAVWGEDTVVDFEHGLNTCIRHIRHALGDDADAPRFIETVPKLGYRFTAAVMAIPPPGARPPRRRILAAAATIVVAVLGAVIARGVVVRGTQQAAVRREAHDLYLRGHLALEDSTQGSARAALELFETALAADATYARAHVGVAQVYLLKPSSIPGVPPDVAVVKAQDAVERALALDESLPEAHVARAELRMTLHDWSGAGREYRRAIDLAPKHSVARQKYAMWLAYQERSDEAVKEARLAESFDPLSLRARESLAEVLRHTRDFDEAFVQAQRVLELNPNFGRAHATLAQCYLAQGKPDAAIEEFRRSGAFPGPLGYAYAVGGRTVEARQIVEALEHRYVSTRGGPGDIAMVYIGLREFDRAFEWLSRAVEDGSVWSLKTAVVWDPIRQDPRFDTLLQKVGYGE